MDIDSCLVSSQQQLGSRFGFQIKFGMTKKIFVLFFCFFVFLFSIACAENVKIDGAEIEWHKYYDKVLINTSDYVYPTVKQSDDMIVLEFRNAEASNFIAKLKKSPRIKSIYPKLSGKNTIQVIIELKKTVKYELASLYGKDQIYMELAEIDQKAIKYEKEEKESVREPIKVEVLAPVKSIKPEARGVLHGKLIVIDPGHGGEDPGAFGFGGIEEKNLTLQTSKYLADYLRANGASVLLTRKSDIKRGLSDVVDFVNSSHADIYVGVHYNSIIGMSVSGTETYYYNQQSYRLASLVHKAMLLCLKRQDRGVRRAMFYTINHSKIPAILVEPMYITDMQEGILAKTKSYQKEIAKSLLMGIKDYFSR